MAEFDIDGARKAGYDDSEIASFLGQRVNFDVDGARKAGYDDGEIVSFLGEKLNPSFGTRMGESFKQGLGQVKVTWDFLANKLERAVTGGEKDTGPILAKSVEEYSRLEGDPKVRELIERGNAEETWGGAAVEMSKYMLRNPSIVATFLAQQTPGIVASLPFGGAGGAAGGLIAGRLGAGAAGRAAAGAAGFGASMNSAQTAVMALGGNYAEGLSKFPDDMAAAEDYAIRKTASEVPANAVAGAFMGISPLISTIGGKVANVLGQSTAQGAGGLIGAQQAAESVGEKLGKGEALMEFGGEFFTAPVDVASEAMSRPAQTGVVRPPDRGLINQGAPTPPPVAPATPPVAPATGFTTPPVDPVQQIAKILDAPSVDEAIVAAQEAVSSLPVMPGTMERDLGGIAQDAEEAKAARRRDFELGQIQESGRDAAVEQAEALTRSGGFGATEPTAMQLAIERARQKSSAVPEAVAPPALLQADVEPDRGVGPDGAAPTLTTEGPGTQAGEAGSGPATSSTIADAAHEAATSPLNDIPEPTEAQKEAGNYKKGHVRISGLDISIENPAGTRRRPEWPELRSHYGYIRGTVGKDKDHIDVFIQDSAGRDYAGPVAVVNQQNKDGTFDEHKVVFGAQDEAQARALYLENYTPGWNGIQSIAMFPSMGAFKAWLRDGDHTKPARSPENALQVGSTETVDVGQRPEDGGALAEGNAPKEEAAESGQTQEGVDRSVNLKPGDKTWSRGDEVTITTDPYELHGSMWQDAITDGGKKVTIPTKEQANDNVEKKKAAYSAQQEEFRRLRKPPAEAVPPTTGETNEAVSSQEGAEAPTDAGQEKALLNPRVAARVDDLRWMAQEAGWAEIGGRIIRDPDTNQVTGRTRWIPRAEWWQGRPGSISERDFREAVRKAAAGEKLKPKEQRAIDYALDYIEERDARVALEAEEQEVADELAELGVAAVSRKISQEDWDRMSDAEREAVLDDIFGERSEPVDESKTEEDQAGKAGARAESGAGRGEAEAGGAQREAVAKHGLPESTVFEPGKYGPLTKGKVRAVAEGQESNWHDTPDAAAAELAQFLSLTREGKEARARRDTAEVVLADKIKAGEKPSFDEWRAAFPQLKVGHTYLRQPDISPFLVKHFGFSKAKIRKPLGRAAGTVTSDGGAQYPIVYFNRLAEVLGKPALESYTEQDIAAREAEQAKKAAAEKDAEAAAERKRKADAERDSFDLTGSDRAADANPNQGDIFAAPQAPKSLKEITVTVPAVDASTGRSMKIKQDAETALNNVESQLEKARSLLQCLHS